MGLRFVLRLTLSRCLLDGRVGTRQLLKWTVAISLGVTGGVRTHACLVHSQTLCQLRYGHTKTDCGVGSEIRTHVCSRLSVLQTDPFGRSGMPTLKLWRRERESNPCAVSNNCLAGSPLKPLGQLSSMMFMQQLQISGKDFVETCLCVRAVVNDPAILHAIRSNLVSSLPASYLFSAIARTFGFMHFRAGGL